jgi:hypothetical protein
MFSKPSNLEISPVRAKKYHFNDSGLDENASPNSLRQDYFYTMNEFANNNHSKLESDTIYGTVAGSPNI